MMKSVAAVVVLLLNFAAIVGATPTPLVTTKVCTTKTCPSSPFGGMPNVAKRAFAVRGGEVLEAATPQEMEAILIRANGALVVVDHWAR